MENAVRSMILKTAEALFVKFGIRSVSIDDICKEIQISKKTFYTEFEQKADLVAEVCTRIVGKQKSEKEQARLAEMAGDNPIDAIFSYRLPLQSKVHKKYAAFMYDLNKYYPEIQQQRLETKADEIRRMLAAFLQSGVEQGWFRNDLNLELLPQFLTKWQSITSQMLQELEPEQIPQFFDVLSDALVRMVCSEKGMAYYTENYLNK
ncbi:MAG: TetR/AcrR family transcriptional regulator [Paludibacteraceae bacterium]|nr:TetR/AcrR family transcriptional regulator [Paludibacteraceae bacterium]